MMLFLYDWLPAAVFQIILVLGIIGCLVSSFISSIHLSDELAKYTTLFRLVSYASLCAGLIWVGIGESEDRFKVKNAEANQRIAVLEARAPEITTRIVTEYKDRIKYQTIKGDTIVKEVPKYISSKSDNNCPVPAGLVRLLNDSANSQVSGTSSGNDGQSTSTYSIAPTRKYFK